MVDLTKLQKDFQINENSLAKKASKRAEALKKKHAKETEGLREENAQEIENARAEYHKRAARVVYNALSEDYEVLQTRASFCETTPTSIQMAQSLLSLQGSLPNQSEAETKIKDLISLLPDKEAVRAAMEVAKYGTPQQKVINSYLGIQGETGYLIIPVMTGENIRNKSLAESLEDKVFGIMAENQVVPGLDNKSFKTEVRARAVTLPFKVEEIVAQGFVTYKITPEKMQIEGNGLDTVLSRKFAELQPEKFSNSKITHNVELLDMQTLQTLVNSTPEDLYSPKDKLVEILERGTEFISMKDAKRITGKSDAALYFFARNYQKKTGLSAKNEQGEFAVSALIKYTDGPIRSSTQKEISSSPHPATAPSRLKLNYQSTTVDGIKEEVDSMLNGYITSRGEQGRVTALEATKIFGLKRNTTFYSLARRNGFACEKDKSSGCKTYSIKEIKQFLNERQPTPLIGWIK